MHLCGFLRPSQQNDEHIYCVPLLCYIFMMKNHMLNHPPPYCLGLPAAYTDHPSSERNYLRYDFRICRKTQKNVYITIYSNIRRLRVVHPFFFMSFVRHSLRGTSAATWMRIKCIFTLAILPKAQCDTSFKVYEDRRRKDRLYMELSIVVYHQAL